MAKLTRTQKFADLRDSLANDKEPSLSTKELNVYEDRLASLTGETLRQQEQESVRKVLDDDPKYIWTAFEESDDNAYDPYSYSKQNDDFLNNRYVWNSLQEFPESNNSYEIENTFNIDELPDINEGRSVEDDLTQIQPFEPIIEDNTMETPVIENVQEEIVETKVEDNPYEVVEETVQEVQVEQPVEETVEQQTEVEETYDSQQSSDLYEEAQLEVDPISTEEFIEQQEARYKELSNTNPAIEEAYAQAEKLAEQGEQNVEQFTEQVQQEVEQLDQDIQETVEQVTQDIQQEVEQLSEEVVEDVKEVVEETPVEEVVEETIEYKQPTEEYTSSQEQQQETYEESVEQDFNPAVEETVEEELQTERVDTEAEKLAAMQFLNDIVDNNEQVTYETEAGEQLVEEVQEAVEQTVEEVIEEPYVEQASQQVQEEVHEELPVEEDTVSQEEVVEDVVEENSVVEMSADNHQPDDIDHGYNSSLIHETINEVGEYNRSVGEETITTLTSNLVNQIRHPERRSERRRYNEVPVEEVNASEDEEFSNTVSLEITKIMDEISNTQEVEKIVESKEEVLEHPVLTKALEDESQEDVVEIKNIKELEAEEATASNTLSNTIPFVVAAGEEDLIEEDEEDDSNTILNIILIVLIMILVAVLGLIIFYILRTRGII